MDDYVIKYASSSVSLLLGQLSHPMDTPTEFIDPICTAIKIALLGYKNVGTKMSIKNNTILIQEPSMLQGIQRWYNQDERHQLHQLRLPLFYFRGLVLKFNGHAFHFEFLNQLVIDGLRKMKMTYDCKQESLIKQSIDDDIKLLNYHFTIDEYVNEVNKLNKPVLFAMYQEYTKLWQSSELELISKLFELMISKQPAVQNKLADCIDEFVNAKDLEIEGIRPI